MEKNKITLICLATLAAILIIYGTLVFTPKTDTIRIGGILPLTGFGAFEGGQFINGMQLAINEINEKGGINGKELELVIEDSQSNPQEAVNAFNNLINLKDPNVIVSIYSAISMSLAPKATEQKIPLVASVATVPNLTNNNWAFRYYPIANQEIPPIIEIAENHNIETIAILYLNDDFGLSMYNKLKEEFNGEVFGESFLASATDFKTELFKIKENNPDAILVVGFTNHILTAIKQIEELNINTMIFSASTISTPTARKGLEASNKEVYAGTPKIYGENIEEKITVFKEKFESEFNKEIDHYAVSGYDTVYLIAQAIEKSGESKEKIKNGLLQIESFNGLFGETEIKGREFNPPLYPAKISGTEIVYLN